MIPLQNLFSAMMRTLWLRMFRSQLVCLYTILILLLLFFPVLIFAQENERNVQPFTDIPEHSSYYIPVKYLKDSGLVSGYADGSFQPERPLNRAEALAMILKAAGIEVAADSENERTLNARNPLQITLPRSSTITIKNLATGEESSFNNIKNFRIDIESGAGTLEILNEKINKPFRDVNKESWFYDIVREGKKRGIVKGYSGGKYFRPQENVNLAEALRMLFQSTGTNTSIGDGNLPPGIKETDWFAADIYYAVNEHVLAQMLDGSIFPPDATLSRGQLALLLYRFLKTKEGAAFGYASWYADNLAETKITSGAEYKNRNLTAAHKTLPFGTVVHVTNMNNGKQIDAVINDRGPFVTGRIVDLSRTAFAALESPTVGVISVQVEVMEK